MDYLSLLQPTPEQQQAALVEKLRRRKDQTAALQAANADASKYDILAAATQMANNQGAALAAQSAQKSAQSRSKPINLGAQGFALPGSGQFIASPMYEDEQDERRTQQRQVLAATLGQRDAAAAQSADIQRERIAAQREAANQRHALGQTMAEIARMRAEAAGAAKGAAGAGNLDKNLQRYSSTLDKAGIPEVLSALKPVEALLRSTKPGELSGFGRVQGMIPDFMATNEMQGNRALMQDAANIILKSRSGAAVTAPEQVRFLRAVGSGVGMDEQTLRTGWQNVMASIAARGASLAAGYGSDVHDEFASRGGQDLRNFRYAPIPGAVLPKSLQGGQPPAGVSPEEWLEMTPEQRALFK